MVKVAITSQGVDSATFPSMLSFASLARPLSVPLTPLPCSFLVIQEKLIIELRFSLELHSRWDMAVKHTSSQPLTPPPPKIHLPWGLWSGAGGKESKNTLGELRLQCLLRWHRCFLGTPHAINGSFVPVCNRPLRHLRKGCVQNKKQHFPSSFWRSDSFQSHSSSCTVAWVMEQRLGGGEVVFFLLFFLFCGNSSGSLHKHISPSLIRNCPTGISSSVKPLDKSTFYSPSKIH